MTAPVTNRISHLIEIVDCSLNGLLFLLKASFIWRKQLHVIDVWKETRIGDE
jgi:hypothetical protein